MSNSACTDQITNIQFGKAANSEFNTLESVESVYPSESIEIVDMLNITASDAEKLDITRVVSNSDASAANEDYVNANVYGLSGARRSKIDSALERRASKSRITDRRNEQRTYASGEHELDRRIENRSVSSDLKHRPSDDN